tara:strand:- start:4549 stop:4875 length:327 start_codon:yes stop_codon:yes gene_type:complete
MPSLSAPLATSLKPSSAETTLRILPAIKKRPPNQAKRTLMASLGILSLVVGFVFFLIPPIPLGAPLLAIGCTLMMKSSTSFRNWALKRSAKAPRIHAFIKRCHEKSEA